MPTADLSCTGAIITGSFEPAHTSSDAETNVFRIASK